MGLLEDIKKDGSLLKNVENQTEELCLAAVTSKGGALKYVKNHTPEIVIAAINQNGGAIHFVTNPSHELIELAVMKNPESLLALAEKYKWEEDEVFLLHILRKQPAVLPYLSGNTVEKLCREYKNLLLEIIASKRELADFCGYCEEAKQVSLIEKQRRCEALYPYSCRRCDYPKCMIGTVPVHECLSRESVVSPIKDEIEAIAGPTKLRYPSGTFSDEVLLAKHIESRHNNALFSAKDIKKIEDMRSVNELLEFAFVYKGSEDEIKAAEENLWTVLRKTRAVRVRTLRREGGCRQFYAMKGLFKEEIFEFMDAVFEKAGVKPYIESYGYRPYVEEEWKKH